MKSISRLVLSSAFALLILAPAAFAQTPEVSTLPVNEPLEVGDTILQPGTYTIRVIPASGDRNRVQITSVDQKTIFATVLTIPHDLQANEEIPSTRLVFFPAANGQPRTLRTWFPPNTAMNAGHDIVYSEARAKQLAQLPAAPADAPLQAVTHEPYQPIPAPQTSSTSVEMPNTASSVPMIALLGLLSIAAAAVVRFAR
jgi:hypothetical protein